MLLLNQMIILFLLMIVGLIIRKIGILTDTGSKTVSTIVVNVANPALILSASINKENVIEGRNLLLAVGIALGIYVFLLVVAAVLPHILKISKGDVGTYRVMTVFSNIGFMGFPLISAVYGSEALLYASVFMLPYNFLIYTWGISAICKKTDAAPEEAAAGDASEEGGASAAAGSLKKGFQWKKIFNVGVISCILTMIIYLTRVPMPSFIESTVTHLSNLTAPLSMIVIGASMADMNFKEMFTDLKLIIFMAIKLIVIPIAGVFAIKAFGMEPDLVGVCMVMLATPVGSMTAMLAQQYDSNYELASRGVALSTILSVATMPLVSLIVGV